MATVIGTVKELIREKSSNYGNPRYTAVIVTDSSEVELVTTKPNSSHGYSIGNYINERVKVETSMYRGKVSLVSVEKV